MKTGGGDFSAEAYEQMRNAYDKEQQRQVDDEVRGTQLMGIEYGLETVPVDSPWKDKIENWTYPTGKGQYLDEKQSPDEVLQVMRDAAQARIEAKNTEEEEEVDEEINEVLNEEDVNIAQMSDEEFDAYITSILEGEEEEFDDDGEEEYDDDDNEEEEDEDDEDEEDEEEEDDEEEDDPETIDEGEDTETEEEDEEDDESEEDVYDPEDIAAQIAELRAEIEDMQFVPTQENDESE